MKNNLIIALSLSALSFSAFSSPLFDVPLAKKCYAVYLRLVIIKEAQTTNQCISKLSTAINNTESAALKIAEDDSYAKYSLESAIYALRHAQVYSCIEEDKIIEAENDLTNIKSQLK